MSTKMLWPFVFEAQQVLRIQATLNIRLYPIIQCVIQVPAGSSPSSSSLSSSSPHFQNIHCVPETTLITPQISIHGILTINSLQQYYVYSCFEKWKSLSRVQLFAIPWVQSTEFSRPEYWSGWPFPSPGDLPNPGIKPRSPTLQVDSLPLQHKLWHKKV